MCMALHPVQWHEILLEASVTNFKGALVSRVKYIICIHDWTTLLQILGETDFQNYWFQSTD